MNNLDQIVAQASADFEAATDGAQLEQAKAKYLGRSGSLTELLKGLGKLEADQRREAGASINRAKGEIEGLLEAKREALRHAALQEQLAAESLDVSLPGRGYGVGGLHPVSRTLERIETLFRSIGFEVADGPEIETDYHNFTALNTPENHPARSMHDTFYLENEDKVLLRTHTSPVQIRSMEAHVARFGSMETMPELRVIIPARVPCRFGRDAFPDVPSGGRPVDRSGYQLRRPQGRRDRFSAAFLRDR